MTQKKIPLRSDNNSISEIIATASVVRTSEHVSSCHGQMKPGCGQNTAKMWQVMKPGLAIETVQFTMVHLPTLGPRKNHRLRSVGMWHTKAKS